MTGTTFGVQAVQTASATQATIASGNHAPAVTGRAMAQGAMAAALMGAVLAL